MGKIETLAKRIEVTGAINPFVDKRLMIFCFKVKSKVKTNLKKLATTEGKK